VSVTAFNTGGATRVVSAQTGPIEPPVQPPANIIQPSLAGVAQVGQVVSASSGDWSGTSPLTIGIEWLRCDAAGGACVVIEGAGSTTRQLGLEDVGMTIRTRVTAVNPGGSATATSVASAVISLPAPGLVSPPTIAGRSQEGQTLTASPGTWTFASELSFQWRRCTADGACTDIRGAVSATYAPSIGDAGFPLQVAVTARNGAGSSSASSALTSVVLRATVHGVPPPLDPTGEPRRLIVLGFSRAPRTPQAGRKFTLVLRVGTRATSTRGAARHVNCSAKLGRRTLRAATRSIRAGVARCAWAVPRNAAGQRLRSRIAVSEGALSVQRTVTATVRGPRLR
jgi:hypothetical protein